MVNASGGKLPKYSFAPRWRQHPNICSCASKGRGRRGTAANFMFLSGSAAARWISATFINSMKVFVAMFVAIVIDKSWNLYP